MAVGDAVTTGAAPPASAAPPPAPGQAERAGRPRPPSRLGRSAVAAGLALVGVLLVVVPPRLSGYRLYLLALIVVYALSTLGLNVLVGWCGQIGLAHAGVFGFGAYCSTILFERGVPFFASLAITAAIASAAGVLIGWPAAQLRGFFLAIATLAFGELILRLLIEADGLTGGGGGLSVELFRWGDQNQTLTAYYVALGLGAAYFFAAWRMLRGRLGRTLRAVQDIEVATGPLAISSSRYKLVAFGISAFTAALAGGAFAQVQTYLSPDLFRTRLLITMLIMLIVGGVRSIVGSVLGAVFAVTIVEVFQDAGEYQSLAFGAALMLAVLVLPGGLASLPARLRGALGRRSGGDLAPRPGGGGGHRLRRSRAAVAAR